SFLDETIAIGPANWPVLIEAPDPIKNFLVLFTSGTTGTPKAISISESLVCQRIQSVSHQLKFEAGSRIFMSGLLNNTTGVIFSFGALLHDATLVFPGNRNVGDWPAQVSQARATHMMLRPVAMKRFVESAQAAPADLSSLRVVAYGAAAMPRSVLEQGRRLMPCEWVQGYGLSETYGPFCWLNEADHRDERYRRHVYCVGRPDDTLQVALRPHDKANGGIGEVVVRGEHVMEGYIDFASGNITPPATWLRTGDLGEFTRDGYLQLKGRADNTVMSENGHRIYPEEVEAVLSDVPGVADVVLLGVAGEETLIVKPVACIHGTLTDCEPGYIRDVVATALAQSLSREKWPGWIFASKTPFPKSGNDKVLKAEVARLIGAEALIEV
ncbi:MAG TPA: fatty acid--CoA ligase family protein, partial [Burkholderiaceae bacterium]